MEEDFLNWHELKSVISDKEVSPLFSEQEIWWCSIGLNVGVEQNGKNHLLERPVLVFKKFNKHMFWCLPMSSKYKFGDYYYNFIFQNESRTLLLSQLRLLNSKRLTRSMGKISDEKFNEIKMKIITIIKKDPL